MTTISPWVHAAQPARPISVGQAQSQRMSAELIIFGMTSILTLALYWTGEYRTIAVFVPIVMLGVNGFANYRMVQADSAMLLTPLFGVRLIAMVVFGLGGLLNAFAPDSAREAVDVLYPTTIDEAARVNLLWLLGMTILLSSIALAMRFHKNSRVASSTARSLRPVSVSLAIRTFVLATLFQCIPLLLNLPLPGVVGTITLAFQLGGLFLIGQLVGTSVRARVAMGLGLATLLLISLFYAAKTLFLYPALVAVLGTLSTRVTWRRVVVGASLILLSFYIISPLVTYLRVRAVGEYGTMEVVRVSDKLRYIGNYIEGDRIGQDDVTSSSSRIDYLMPASLVMALYDQGMGTDRLRDSLFILIPRVIWPDKPITSGSGLEVNHALGIQTDNQIGMTTFADLYWSLGWYGLAIVPLLGFYFGIVTIMCQSIVSRGEWIMLPFALASFRLGLNLDNDFPAAMMAPAIINIAIYFGLRAASRMLERLPNAALKPVTAAPR